MLSCQINKISTIRFLLFNESSRDFFKKIKTMVHVFCRLSVPLHFQNGATTGIFVPTDNTLVPFNPFLFSIRSQKPFPYSNIKNNKKTRMRSSFLFCYYTVRCKQFIRKSWFCPEHSRPRRKLKQYNNVQSDKLTKFVCRGNKDACVT